MYPVSVRNFPRPEWGALCIFTGDLISKIALVFFTPLSASKTYFGQSTCYSDHIKCKTIHGGLLVVVIIQSKTSDLYKKFVILNQKRYIMWYCTLNYDDNFIYLLCFIFKCHLSLFFSQILNQWFLGILCNNSLRRSKNYKNFDFQYRSAPTLEVTQLPLNKINKHLTAEQYQGSANNGELYIKSGVDWMASGKIRQPTSVSSQCEILSYTWTWRPLYFDCWPHF